MGEKTAGVGHFMIPTAPSAGISCTSGAANVFTTTYVQLIASTVAALYITGIYCERAASSAATYTAIQLATGGAGSETIVDQELMFFSTGSTVTQGYHEIWPPIAVAAATRISVKTADSVGAVATLITLSCLAQANVVTDGVVANVNVSSINSVSTAGVTTVSAVQGLTTANTITTVTNQLTAAAIATGVWQDTTSGDFTTALSVGKSVMNGVALGTGLTVAAVSGAVGSVTGAVGSVTGNVGGNVTGSVASVVGAVGSVTGLTASNLDATVSSRMATFTQPTGFLAVTFPAGTVANTTNITAGTITTATNLTNAPTVGDLTAAMKTSVQTAADAAITANVTVVEINADVDELITSVAAIPLGVPLTSAQTASAVWQDATAGDFTTASSIGKSVYNAFTANSSVYTVASLANAPSGGAAPTAAQVATAVWQDTTAGDFTTALSVGKSVMNGVALGTGLTVANVTNAIVLPADLTATMKTSVQTAADAAITANSAIVALGAGNLNVNVHTINGILFPA